MAATVSINAGEGINRVATGTYLDAGTVAAYDFNIGFKPKWVRLVNETGGHSLEWNETMADAEGLKTTEDSGTVDIAMITSNGITPLDNGTTRGFRMGLDTDINVTSETVSFIAVG